jgi:hypothetical protein
MSTLHLHVSTSRGGLVLPPLFSNEEYPPLFPNEEYSLLNTFRQFFSHPWHLYVLHHGDLSPESIMYLLVASTWLQNLRTMDKELKAVAFNDIRRPNIKINDQLHDFREKVAIFKYHVSDAKKWMPQHVRQELEIAKERFYSNLYLGFPDSVLESILTEVDNAERFLMDTFQLLMSSISVLDSETSIQQARSAQKLTQLAFIFIPLSFVTGIFGMNIKEINGSPVSIWVCVVMSIVTIACTMGIAQLLDWWQSHQVTAKAKEFMLWLFYILSRQWTRTINSTEGSRYR